MRKDCRKTRAIQIVIYPMGAVGDDGAPVMDDIIAVATEDEVGVERGVGIEEEKERLGAAAALVGESGGASNGVESASPARPLPRCWVSAVSPSPAGKKKQNKKQSIYKRFRLQIMYL